MTPALHPALAAWFEASFPGFTEIQQKALPHTLALENTLILAPTGSGKTLAAFLSVLSSLAARASVEGLPNAVCAIYVTPLKALGRDIHRNLEVPLAAINATLPEKRRIRHEVRTGDTAFSERNRQQRRRPHLLLTTPETLSTLLSQSAWRDRAFEAGTVIVDEIHAFAEGKRGPLLALALERLAARSAKPLQRIGVSATAWPIESVTRLLCGELACRIARVDLQKAHRLEIAVPPPDLELPAAGYNPFRIAAPVADLVTKAGTTLIFTATRSAAERLGLALKILLPEFDDRIAVHHGSVARLERQTIEQGLAEGSLKAVVCSTSLELGVDFSAVDQVLLIGAPRGVSRALQRLGRSGHRVDGVATGSLVALSLPDLLECIALRQAARQGHLDTLRVPQAPLDVLAQVLLAMSIERPYSLGEAFQLVRRAGPYRDLSRADFDAVIEYLAGGGKVLGPYGTYGKIVVFEDKFVVASKKVARQYYLNAGVITDDFQVKIVTKTNRRLGEVEENFLASLQPGEAFLIGGKPVRVRRVQGNVAMVEPAEGERVRTPRWMGGKMPLSAQLAQTQLLLRQDIRRELARGAAPCTRMLIRKWDIPPAIADRITQFAVRQTQAAPIPVRDPVQVEWIERRRSLLLQFHVVAGRAVNRSLAWVLAARIAQGGSAVANFDDHSFLLSLDRRHAPTLEQLRDGFRPEGWKEDLERTIATTDALGRKFRAVAEVGQLLQRRIVQGGTTLRTSSWSGSLLYATLREHEPEHPLVREAVREVLEDQCDAEHAQQEAARIFEAQWEVFRLPRPSPFALPLYAAFNREVLLSQDPDKALHDLVSGLYEEWSIPA